MILGATAVVSLVARAAEEAEKFASTLVTGSPVATLNESTNLATLTTLTPETGVGATTEATGAATGRLLRWVH